MFGAGREKKSFTDEAMLEAPWASSLLRADAADTTMGAMEAAPECNSGELTVGAGIACASRFGGFAGLVCALLLSCFLGVGEGFFARASASF